MKNQPPPLSTVAKLFPGEAFVCLGTGPSLAQSDVDFVRGKARVIAVNDAYKVARWADVLFAADSKWYRWETGVPSFKGLKFTVQPQPEAWPGLQVLRNTGREGLELNPAGLRTGYNSGYQAINLAVHLGASRIVLLGYDMQGTHFFGQHRDKTVPPFPACLQCFPTLVAPLAELGIPILNATRQTALTCFPLVALEQALAERAA